MYWKCPDSECGHTLSVEDWTYEYMALNGTPQCECDCEMELVTDKESRTLNIGDLMKVEVTQTPSKRFSGRIVSGLDRSNNHNALDGIESLVLACACAGINVESQPFVEAVQTALDAILNND